MSSGASASNVLGQDGKASLKEFISEANPRREVIELDISCNVEDEDLDYSEPMDEEPDESISANLRWMASPESTTGLW